jgi:ribose 5-phosphate isomerase B
MFILVADHGGFAMKESMKAWLSDAYGQIILDCTPKKVAGDDFPTLAQQAALEVKKAGDDVRVIAFCRSGAGIAIALNRYRYMRAVQGWSVSEVQRARTDEDVNAVAIGADLQSLAAAKKIIAAFLETSFQPKERHIRRVKQLSTYGQV